VVSEGLSYEKLPGDWYGVGCVSKIMETLNDKYRPIDTFKICVFQDGIVILEDIKEKAA